jgi:hypothetical protein
MGNQPIKKSSRFADEVMVDIAEFCVTVRLLKTGRLDRCSGRQGFQIDEDTAVLNTDAVGGDALVEGGRRLAIVRVEFPTVPRAGDAAVDDLALTERSPLVGTDVRHCRDLTVVTEHRYSFATGKANDLRPVVRDLIDTANIYAVTFGWQRIAEALAQAGGKVENGDKRSTKSNQRCENLTLFRTKRS